MQKLAVALKVYLTSMLAPLAVADSVSRDVTLFVFWRRPSSRLSNVSIKFHVLLIHTVFIFYDKSFF